jgi:hypothetical protein
MAEEYADLSREQLASRLRLAEDVCLMYGWSVAHNETDREKATYMLWSKWRTEVGEIDRADHPHLSDEAVERLARDRDEVHARVLAAVRSEAAAR